MYKLNGIKRIQGNKFVAEYFVKALSVKAMDPALEKRLQQASVLANIDKIESNLRDKMGATDIKSERWVGPGLHYVIQVSFRLPPVGQSVAKPAVSQAQGRWAASAAEKLKYVNNWLNNIGFDSQIHPQQRPSSTLGFYVFINHGSIGSPASSMTIQQFRDKVEEIGGEITKERRVPSDDIESTQVFFKIPAPAGKSFGLAKVSSSVKFLLYRHNGKIWNPLTWTWEKDRKHLDYLEAELKFDEMKERMRIKRVVEKVPGVTVLDTPFVKGKGFLCEFVPLKDTDTAAKAQQALIKKIDGSVNNEFYLDRNFIKGEGESFKFYADRYLKAVRDPVKAVKKIDFDEETERKRLKKWLKDNEFHYHAVDPAPFDKRKGFTIVYTYKDTLRGDDWSLEDWEPYLRLFDEETKNDPYYEVSKRKDHPKGHMYYAKPV